MAAPKKRKKAPTAQAELPQPEPKSVNITSAGIRQAQESRTNMSTDKTAAAKESEALLTWVSERYGGNAAELCKVDTGFQKLFQTKFKDSAEEEESFRVLVGKIGVGRCKVLLKEIADGSAEETTAPSTTSTGAKKPGRKASGNAEEIMERVHAFLKKNPGAARAGVLDALGISAGQWTTSINALVTGKRVTQSGNRKSATYTAK